MIDAATVVDRFLADEAIVPFNYSIDVQSADEAFCARLDWQMRCFHLCLRRQ